METEKISTIERTNKDLNELIANVAKDFKFELGEDKFLDLREATNESVLEFLNSLRNSGKFVFHGSSHSERITSLEPRKANDASKESGNKKAIYADAGITVPLSVAVLNRDYIKNKFNGWTIGWTSIKGKMLFKFDANIYGLFKSGDENLFKDGYLYVFDKSKFINAEDAGAEWHSESAQKPVLTCLISKNMAEEIFIFGKGDKDTVVEYSEEEMKRMEEFDKEKKAEQKELKLEVVPMGDPVLDSKIKEIFGKYNVAEMVSSETELNWQKEPLKIKNGDKGDWEGDDAVVVNYSRGLWATSTAAHELFHLILRQNDWDKYPRINDFIEAHPETSTGHGRGYKIEQMVAYLLQRDIHRKIGRNENDETLQTGWDSEHYEKIITKEFDSPFLEKMARTIMAEWPNRKGNILEWLANVLKNLN